MTIFHSVGRGRVVGGKISDGKKRNTRKAYGRGGMRGGKNSNVHSAVRTSSTYTRSSSSTLTSSVPR